MLPPARKLRQGNVFTPVCHSVHTHPLPPGQTPPGQTHPPWADTSPLGRHITPGQTHHLWAVHAGTQSTSGWYASYWNAFSFCIYVCISSCTMETSCEAYKYNVTDEGTCHLLNGTSSAAKTLLSDKEIQIYVKGKVFGE